jgi:hypothetical protein
LNLSRHWALVLTRHYTGKITQHANRKKPGAKCPTSIGVAHWRGSAHLDAPIWVIGAPRINILSETSKIQLTILLSITLHGSLPPSASRKQSPSGQSCPSVPPFVDRRDGAGRHDPSGESQPRASPNPLFSSCPRVLLCPQP